tara:strand:+ start:235 stop:1599 length:1365 start_codon:yes stop_codon:yes gene_type:complete
MHITDLFFSPVSFWQRDALEVKRFLNRLLGLTLDRQRLLFDAFSEALNMIISAAKRDGRYEEGIADISGSSVRLLQAPLPIWRDPLTGARASSALVQVDRGVSFEAAREKLAKHRRGASAPAPAAAEADAGVERGGGAGVAEAGEVSVGGAKLPEASEAGTCEAPECILLDQDEDETPAVIDLIEEEEEKEKEKEEEEEEEEEEEPTGEQPGGFFRSKFLYHGEHIYVLALPKANRPGVFFITRPNTGPSPFDEEAGDLFRKYEPVPARAARAGWCASHEGALHENLGGRLSVVSLITGSTLPLMPVLEGIVAKHAGELSRKESSVVAARVQLGSQRLLGVRFAPSLIEELRAELLRWTQATNVVGNKVIIDPIPSVDQLKLTKIMTKPTTLLSFFGPKRTAPAPAPAPKASAPLASTSSTINSGTASSNKRKNGKPPAALFGPAKSAKSTSSS